MVNTTNIIGRILGDRKSKNYEEKSREELLKEADDLPYHAQIRNAHKMSKNDLILHLQTHKRAFPKG